MKKLKKVGVIVSVVAALLSMFCINTSAATINDGLKAEIQVEASNSNDTSVKALLSNQNYYEIDGVNMLLTVSDNAILNGDIKLSDINLSADQQKSLLANVSLKQQPQQTTEATQPTQETTQAVQSTTQSVTQAATQAAVNSTAPSNAVTIGSSKKDNTAVQTGNNSFMLFAGALAVIIVGVVMVVSFKKGKKRVISIMLCATLTLSVVSVSIGTAGAAETSRKTFVETQQIQIDNQTVTLTLTVDYPEQAEIHDNSLDDIKVLNKNDVDVTYNQKNTISFLNAEYTDYKVTDIDTALNSLAAVSTLIGITGKDVSVVPLNTKTMDNGDVYYTFRQNVGALILDNASVTVGVDKDGKTLCVSNSLMPDAGTKEVSDNIITEKQAEETALSYVKNSIGDCKLADAQPMLEYDQSSQKLCRVIYVERILTVEEELSELGKYIKLYVDAANDEVVSLMYVSGINDTESENTYDNDIFFKVDTQMMSFENYFGKTVELPVAQNKDGLYYFCDTERRILCSDTEKTNASPVAPVAYTFESAKDVSPVFVSVFENIRTVYDWYAENGIESVNGNGVPILVNFGYKKNGVEIANASCSGIVMGWGYFTFSNTKVSAALDVVAHEYTHGVKNGVTGSAEYSNATGSIEESYADILGNLTEMITHPENSDTENWTLGESSNNAIRSMSNPHFYNQPEYIGDAYYMMSGETYGNYNDNGGVHKNNSVLSHIAYLMYKNGISMTDDFDIWFNTFTIFDVNAHYSDICAYVKYTVERKGLSQYLDTIDFMFKDAKVYDADTITWNSCEVPEGYTKVIFTIDNLPENAEYGVDWAVINLFNDKQLFFSQDYDGTYGAIFNSDKALLIVGFADNETQTFKVSLVDDLIDSGYNFVFDEGEYEVHFDYETIKN